MHIEKNKINKRKGFSMIEALVFLFIFTITVLSFYKAFSMGTSYILESKNRLAATQVANEKMEIIRSLEYAKIGTKTPNGSGGWNYGTPRGDILQEEEVNKNTRKYFVRTAVIYNQDSFDGVNSPADPRPADHKTARVQVSWVPTFDANKVVELISTFVPQGVESNTSGAIMSVNVQDAGGNLISAASVKLTNLEESVSQTNPTVNGNAMFFELPADLDPNYNIEVSKSGYYTARTYPPYDPGVAGSFDARDKNTALTTGALWQGDIKLELLSTLKISTKDMMGNDIPNVVFDLKGGRDLGTTVPLGSMVVYSYDKTGLNSGADAELEITDTNGISPGLYAFNFATPPTNYTFVKMKNATTNVREFYLNPGVNLEEEALYADNNANAFLGTVKSDDGTLISGASVQLKNTTLGYDVTLTSDAFGMVYFPNNTTPLVADTYEVIVNAAGFATLNDSVVVNALTTKDLLVQL